MAGWDFAGADLWWMHQLGGPSGFPLRNHPVLSTVLHDRLRQGLWIAYALVWCWVFWPVRPGSVSRRERLVVALTMLVCLGVVAVLKRASATSCPWDLQSFGGTAHYVSHWQWGIADGGPGHCFPGGHASGPLSLVALALPWWLPATPGARHPRTGTVWLAAAIGLGLVAGAAQTWRGAHYPGHTGWTALLCAVVSLGIWQACRPWAGARG